MEKRADNAKIGCQSQSLNQYNVFMTDLTHLLHGLGFDTILLNVNPVSNPLIKPNFFQIFSPIHLSLAFNIF